MSKETIAVAEKAPANNTVIRDLVLRELTAEQIDNRQAEFVISTEAVDDHGTAFLLAGWDFERFENNPLVCYGHRWWDGDPDNVIGTGEVFIEGEELIGRVTFESEEVNRKAEKIFKKVKAGTMRMASIGALPKSAHWGVEEAGEDPTVLYFDDQELIEFSIVPIGSNPDALKRSTAAIEEFKKDYARDSKTEDLAEENNENVPQQITRREAQSLIYNYKNNEKK